MKTIKLTESNNHLNLILLGEPVSYLVHSKEEVVCRAIDCKICEQTTIRPDLRILLNCYSLENEKLRVLEMNTSLFRQVLRARDNLGLEGHEYTLTVLRNEKNSKYMHFVSPRNKLSVHVKEELKKLKLKDLEKLIAKHRKQNRAR